MVATPDQVSLGVLVTAVPRDAVDDAIVVCGVGAKRSDGKLPPHVVAYLTMALCLFPEDDYTEVVTKVTGSLDQWGCWNAAWRVPTSSAVTQARKRMGRNVFPEIFERVCGPVGGESSPVAAMVATGRARGSWLRNWRLMAIDGFDVDIPDTQENAAEFGYAGSGDTRSAYPKARVVAMSECGTHTLVAAEIGSRAVGEQTMALGLYPRLRDDELLTADRGFYSFQAWGLAAGTGAALVWRAPTRLRLPVVKVLDDGTFLSVVMKPGMRDARRERILAKVGAGEDIDPTEGSVVRVVEYDVPDRVGGGTGEVIALLSTITDPAEASAEELADAYHQRWEQETAHDQLKTHMRRPGKVLRSRLPDLVYQEIWAWLIVHHTMTALIARAAEAADRDPDQVSFTKTSVSSAVP
ncbi:IS4 family transposase [Amycolatopsis minnesotensis]|uniref:IS4 family transposase n=1 Tax=Amycolatopsis minnesotensis TaxID=337894 RepID=A0ABN2QRA7_9PSEU